MIRATGPLVTRILMCIALLACGGGCGSDGSPTNGGSGVDAGSDKAGIGGDVSCEDDQECADNLVCRPTYPDPDPDDSPHACLPLGKVFDYCDTDDDCVADLKCESKPGLTYEVDWCFVPEGGACTKVEDPDHNDCAGTLRCCPNESGEGLCLKEGNDEYECPPWVP